MIRPRVQILTKSYSLALCVTVLLCEPGVIFASPAQVDSVQICGVFDYEQWLAANPLPIGKIATEQNVGAPRTVRMIYFLPNDRPFRQEVVDSMKSVMPRLQTFFAEGMEAHGYDEKTFHFETNAHGEPLVHRVDGIYSNSHYIEATLWTVTDEIRQAFVLDANIYFIVVDCSSDVIGLGGGQFAAGAATISVFNKTGYAMVPSGFGFGLAAHELTHTFGLNWHGFFDYPNTLKSTGESIRLSSCSAGFLAVHAYFNPEISLNPSRGPNIKRVSPARYPAGAESVSIRLKLDDPDGDGLHQVLLFVPESGGGRYIKECRILSGNTRSYVDFKYDGVFPSSSLFGLSDPKAHNLRVVAVGTDGGVGIADLSIAEDSPYRIATLNGPPEFVNDVALSPDGGTLAVGSNDRKIALWNISTRKQVSELEGPRGGTGAIAFSPTGTILASGARSGEILLWDLANGEATLVGRHSANVVDMAFSPDGLTLVSAGLADDIILWEVATRQSLGTVQTRIRDLRSVVYSPDGSMLAAAGLQGPIVLFDVTSLKEVATMERGRQSYTSLAFSPDGSTLAAGSLNNTIVLWDVASRREVTEIGVAENARWVNTVAFSHDRATLAAGTGSGTIVMSNVLSGIVEQAFVQTAEVGRVVFSPDGATLVGASTDGVFELWDTSEWLRPRPFRLQIISGDRQQGRSDEVLPRPLIVEVRDQYGDPLPDIPVTFTVSAGNGTLDGRVASERVTKSDTSGQADTFLTLGPDPGPNSVSVSLGGRELVRFDAEGVGANTNGGENDPLRWYLPEAAISGLGRGAISESDRGVDFSGDGRFLAVACGIGVWVYEVATYTTLALLRTERGVHSISFSADGATLAVAIDGYRFELWDVKTGTRIGTIEGHKNRVRSVVFSSDGATLASGALDGVIKVWDVASREEKATLEGHTTLVTSLAFSTDGNKLASGSYDGTVRLWDVHTWEENKTLDGHTGLVNSVAFSPDGGLLAYALDLTVILWDLTRGEEIATLRGHTDVVNSLVFSPDGSTLATASGDNTVKLWDVAAKVLTSTLNDHTNGVQSVAFSPDGTIFVSAGGDGEVLLRNSETGNKTGLSGFMSIHAMATSADGANLAIASASGEIQIWDLSRRSQIASLTGHTTKISSLAFSPDGTVLASSAGDALIKLWHLPARDEIVTLRSRFRESISSMVFSPDGAILASSTADGLIKLWDWSTGNEIAVLKGHTSEVATLMFSPDGTTLASGASDGAIKLWEMATRKEIATLEWNRILISSLVFSPDGSTLVAAGGSMEGIRLWDVGSEMEIATMPVYGYTLAMSSSGAVLASGDAGGRIELSDIATQKSIAVLDGHVGTVLHLMFSPDGSTLVSGSDDGTVLVWDMSFLLAPSSRNPDFDGDGRVGFSDFVQFAAKFGLTRRDIGFEVRYDLDRNGTIGFSDFVILAGAFGMVNGD